MTDLPIAPLSESEEIKYRKKCKALKKRIAEIELANDTLITKLARTKRYIQRTRLERAFLLEKLESIASKEIQAEDDLASPTPPASPGFETYLAQKHPGHSANKAAASPEPSRASNGQFKSANGTPSASKLRDEAKPTPNANQPKSKAQVRRDRDPDQPRRPKNAFLRFCDQEREAIKANWQGDETGEPLDLSRELGKIWQAMDETRRKMYQDQFEEDKLRYERENTAYEAMKAAKARDAASGSMGGTPTDGSLAPGTINAEAARPAGSSPVPLGHADSAADEDEQMTDIEDGEDAEEEDEEGESEQDSADNMDEDDSNDDAATEDGASMMQTPSVVKKPSGGGGFTAVNSPAM
jgi:non-histone protein 10